MKEKYFFIQSFLVVVLIIFFSLNHINLSLNQFLSSDEIFLLGGSKGVTNTDFLTIDLSKYIFFLNEKKIIIENTNIHNNPFLYSLKVSAQTSYAPLSPFLSNMSFNLFSFLDNEILRLRVINLFFGISTIFLYLILLKPISDISNIFIFLLANTSAINVYYQSTALPYSLFSFILLLNFIFLINFEKIIYRYGFNKSLLIFFSIFIISFYNHWALILISFLTFIFCYGDFSKLKNNYLYLSLLISSISILILISYFFFIKDDLDFVNRRNDINVEISKLNEIFKLFIMIFDINFSMSSNNVLNKLLSIFGIINFIFFVIVTFKKRSKLSFYILIGFLSYFIAGLLGKYPLTPTRHIIIFYPYLIFMIFLNLSFLKNKFQLKKNIYLIKFPMLILIIIICLMNFFFFKSQLNNDRVNYLIDIENIEKINKDIKKYNIKKIYGSHDIYNFYFNNDYIKKEISFLDIDKIDLSGENFMIISYQNNKYGLHDWEYKLLKKKISEFNQKTIILSKGMYFDFISKRLFEIYKKNFDRSSLNYLQIDIFLYE